MSKNMGTATNTGVQRTNMVPSAEAAKFSVEEKFARSIISLRKIRPFYSAVYETIKKVETDEIETMGVTPTTLVYNKNFVECRKYEEFLFIVLHEIAHIALMHNPRGDKKDPPLWNIACDLIVNKLLADEFGLRPGMTKDKIDMPTDCLYTETLDINTETTEEVYSVLDEQAKKNGYYDAVADNTNIGETMKFRFTYRGTLPGEAFDKDIVVTFTSGGSSGSGNGTGTGDLINDGSDVNQQLNDNKQVIQEAKTRHEMSSSGDGDGAGNQTGGLLEQVTKLLKSKIDWRKLLKKYCIQYVSKDTSYKIPDKRMYYQDAIYPGQYSESEDVLKDVKVCIDTSGSISPDDLAYIMGQVDSLMKTYKTKAEVLCWDTEVESTFELDSLGKMSDRRSYQLKGRGGTDPRCIFKYFDSPKCKVKPFVTLIFTDGYFYENINFTEKDRRNYKNTIWIMTRGYNKDFVPEIGKLAFAKFSDEREH